MTALPASVGSAVALGLVLLAAPRRPAGVRALRPPTPRGQRAPSGLERLGRMLARRTHLDDDPGTARRLASAALVALVMLPVLPPLAPGLVVGAWLRAKHQQHRARTATRRAVLRTLPDAVDLLALCTTGGTGLALAHGEVARRVDGPVGAALVQADRRASAGRSRADALVESLTPLGDRAAALGHVLADHLRYGTPLGPALDRIGIELRLDRRRQAEEDARRVPVRLLGPLVACTLPAFAVLTVVPLLMASLRQLPT